MEPLFNSTYDAGEWEAQQGRWRALITDPIKLAGVVRDLRRVGLELCEDGIVRLIERGR